MVILVDGIAVVVMFITSHIEESTFNMEGAVVHSECHIKHDKGGGFK